MHSKASCIPSKIQKMLTYKMNPALLAIDYLHPHSFCVKGQTTTIHMILLEETCHSLNVFLFFLMLSTLNSCNLPLPASKLSFTLNPFSFLFKQIQCLFVIFCNSLMTCHWFMSTTPIVVTWVYQLNLVNRERPGGKQNHLSK